MRLGGRCRDRIYRIDRADELMSLILAFSSTRLLLLCFALGVGLFLSVMSLKGLIYMGSQRPGLWLYGIVGVPLFVWALLVL